MEQFTTGWWYLDPSILRPKEWILIRGPTFLLAKLPSLLLAVLTVKVAKDGTGRECANTGCSSTWPADRFNFITLDLALPTSETESIRRLSKFDMRKTTRVTSRTHVGFVAIETGAI